MSAELGGRRAAAVAVLADFKRETDGYLDDPARAVARPDMGMWAWRLSSELASVLQRLDDEDAAPVTPAAPVSDSERPFAAVPRLRRVLCTRTVRTDGNPEPCGLPVDHDPDEKCPGNPHARPAPEASQP